MLFSVVAVNVYDRTFSLWTDDKHRPKRGSRTLDRINARNKWAETARRGYMLVNGMSPAESVAGLRERVANDRDPDADRFTLAGLTGGLLHLGRAMLCAAADAIERNPLPESGRKANERLPEVLRTKDLSLVRAHVEKDLSEALYWPEDLVQKLLGEPGSAKLDPATIKTFIPHLVWVPCEQEKPNNREWTALLWPKIGDHLAQSSTEALTRSFVSRRSPADVAPSSSRGQILAKATRAVKRPAPPIDAGSTETAQAAQTVQASEVTSSTHRMSKRPRPAAAPPKETTRVLRKKGARA